MHCAPLCLLSDMKLGHGLCTSSYCPGARLSDVMLGFVHVQNGVIFLLVHVIPIWAKKHCIVNVRAFGQELYNFHSLETTKPMARV